MAETSYPEQAEAAGFEVRLLHESYSDPNGTVYPALYQVDGHGASMSLTEDADEMWAGLLGQAEAAATVDPNYEDPHPQDPPGESPPSAVT